MDFTNSRNILHIVVVQNGYDNNGEILFEQESELQKYVYHATAMFKIITVLDMDGSNGIQQ